MTIEVGEGFGVVGNHGVQVQGLRVAEVGVGDGNGYVGPVGAEPAAEAVGVVARAEVVVAGFGVALLAGNLGYLAHYELFVLTPERILPPNCKPIAPANNASVTEKRTPKMLQYR